MMSCRSAAEIGLRIQIHFRQDLRYGEAMGDIKARPIFGTARHGRTLLFGRLGQISARSLGFKRFSLRRMELSSAFGRNGR